MKKHPSIANSAERAMIGILCGIAIILSAFGLPIQAQIASQTPASTSPAPSAASEAKKSSETPTTAAVVVTDPRQAQIIADSQKLLKLSQELKAEIAKTNKDTLSIAVIKKADEVEKLAKVLKEEMSKAR